MFTRRLPEDQMETLDVLAFFGEVSTGIVFVSWGLNIWLEQWGGCSGKTYIESNNVMS